MTDSARLDPFDVDLFGRDIPPSRREQELAMLNRHLGALKDAGVYAGYLYGPFRITTKLSSFARFISTL